MFKAKDAELIEKFKSLITNDDLADLLEVRKRSLLYFAYSRKSFYSEFHINKKNGDIRVIYSPVRELKTLQRKILYVLSLVYKPKDYVYGFIENRSALDNAKRHEGKKEVLSIDLKDFFYQFHFGRVKGMLMKGPYNVGEEAANTLSNLVCVKVYNGSDKETILPQGAPTSPIISNMICSSFDNEMNRFAKRNHLVYSRYADDIVLSSYDSSISKRMVSVLMDGKISLSEDLSSIFEKHRLCINDNKTKLRKYYQRQMVTGIIVNNQVNIKREYIREIRSILHNAEHNGIYHEALKYANKKSINLSHNPSVVEEWFKEVLFGKISYLGYVTNRTSGSFYDLAKKANRLFNEDLFELSDIFNEADIVDNNVFIIENAEETKQGTCFVVPGLGIFTCNHVLENSVTKCYYNSFYIYDRHGYSNGKIPLLEKIPFDKSSFPFDKDLDFSLFYGIDKLIPRSKKINIGDSDHLSIGSKVVLIGYPEYLSGTHHRIATTITSIVEKYNHPLCKVADVIKHGFSGGIVLNTKNEVVGIVSTGISSLDAESDIEVSNSDYGFVPINCIMKYIEEIYDIRL